MKAYIMVAQSKRLPRKHEIEVIPGKRLIDLVVENLQNLGFDVIVYSKYRIDVDAKVVIDKSSWILPSIISLLQIDTHFFLFGGDMPLIKKDAVKTMLKQMDNDKTLIPLWSKTGYLEPLHGFYTKSSLPCFLKEMKMEKSSLTHALKSCSGVKFVPAETMPVDTFFNVNYQEDVEKLRYILKLS